MKIQRILIDNPEQHRPDAGLASCRRGKRTEREFIGKYQAVVQVHTSSSRVDAGDQKRCEMHPGVSFGRFYKNDVT
jgi:hypothetical protein